MIQNSKNRGFTLVEMMIVVGIIAILAAIAAPNLKPYMEQKRVSGAARQVMTDLMEARMKAATQNNQFKIIFLDNHRYKVLDDDNNNNSEDSGEMTTIRDIQTAYYDVTLSANNNPIFYPRGTAAELTTVILTNSGGTKQVRVAASGRVRIQ